MEPYLVLVVGDDLETVTATKADIDGALDAETLVTRTAEAARNAAAVRPDVVIAAEQLAAEIRDAYPGVPVLPATASAEQISSAADAFRLARVDARKQVVLAIGAHPDDVEMGVGGILAAHRAAGDSVTVLTLSMGHRPGGAEVALAEGQAAADVIGATLIAHPEIELIDEIGDIIDQVVASLKPTIVYTHSASDRRAEHRAVHEATLTAVDSVGTVASYHGTTGSTDFNPTRFVTVDDGFEQKLAMLASFAATGERPPYLEPGFIESTGRYWSQYGLGTYVEPLEVLRESALAPLARS